MLSYPDLLTGMDRGQGKGKLIQHSTVHGRFGENRSYVVLHTSELSLLVQNNYVYKQFNYFFVFSLFFHWAVLFIP